MENQNPVVQPQAVNPRRLAIFVELKKLLSLWSKRGTLAGSFILNNNSLLYECSVCLSIFRSQESLIRHYPHCKIYKKMNTDAAARIKSMPAADPNIGTVDKAVQTEIQSDCTDLQEQMLE